MSISRRRRRRDADKPKYHSSAFGGWGDYRLWAENQFLPKPVEEVEEEDDDTQDVEADDDTRDVEAAVVDVGREEAHDDPEEFWADVDDHHVGISPDTVPRVSPAPIPAPDWPPPYPAPYQQDSRPVGPRPYVLTGGRTSGDGLLRMDSLISVTPTGMLSVDNPALSPEYRWICDMCQEPMAVIEIAGRIRAPLGVAIVLISDAIGWNLLRVHSPAEVDGQPSIELIVRVHEGLRRLR
ncbi:DUF742 domain-containing protein [Streptosporangium sp. NBC_01810]|uniref:DUF742 domain-containing protein n=1 Tax=Streptosporangium sp. NBC_01810 TaxID=2975951 RepID=UPI002DD9E205|nr:DUF742 domain-containing protein [Streptosporangium sp. NBC_01810]WSA29381.1 DUF742 domain-containing protein [Streptosporangium sp. NBC_01810]